MDAPTPRSPTPGAAATIRIRAGCNMTNARGQKLLVAANEVQKENSEAESEASCRPVPYVPHESFE